MRHNPLLPFIAAACLAVPAFVRPGGFGSTAGLLMAEGLAVRPLGLAGAFTALADDESSLHANPAGLARLQGLALGGGHAIGLADTRVSWLDLGLPFSGGWALGLQASYLGVSDPRTDASGELKGSFDTRMGLAGLALARELAPGWRFGAQAKGLREEIDGKGGNAFAGDLGLQGPLGRGWRFGLAALNAGSQAGVEAGRQAFPTPLRLQGGVSLPLLTPAWQAEADLQALPNEGQARLLLGTELSMAVPSADAAKARNLGLEDPRLALRCGAQAGLLKAEEARVWVGAGVALPPTYRLDYALQSLGSLGLTHRFSLALQFQGRVDPAPRGAALSAPYGLTVEERLDGIVLNWSDPNERASGYNVYSDYGVVVERLNPAAVRGRQQKFVNVTRSRLYNFYVRPVGSDGKEGPASEVLPWMAK